MTTHTAHRAGLLADGCPRCDEHARDPLSSLDDGSLRNLIIAIRAGNSPRSTNEAIAMGKVRDALNQASRLHNWMYCPHCGEGLRGQTPSGLGTAQVHDPCPRCGRVWIVRYTLDGREETLTIEEVKDGEIEL